MSWQNYRKVKVKTTFGGNFFAVRKKIRHLRQKTLGGEKLLSSLSLPNYQKRRLRYMLQKYNTMAQEKRWPLVSESEVLLGCLVLLLTKLKNKETLFRKKQHPRNRLYNDDKYAYETVTVYANRYLWNALKIRAVELEVSLSFLADLALRLFLRQVFNRLIQKGGVLRVSEEKPFTSLKISRGKKYLDLLLQKFSYQKKLALAKYGAPERGSPAYFKLIIDYSFG